MQKLIGYVGLKDLEKVAVQDAECLDTVNLAFAGINNGKCVFDDSGLEEGVKRLKQINPEIKILLSVGGWGCGGFSEMASDIGQRKRFAGELFDITEKYGLDGADLDWEYPCMSLAGIESSSGDRYNFTELLREIREQFDSGSRYRMLTIAAGGDEFYLKCTQMNEVCRYVDYVQIMTYDLRGGFVTQAGHHTNLYPDTADILRSSVDTSVRMYMREGVPPEKIVIGAAFYSRVWHNVADRNHGLGQAAGTVGVYGGDYGELEESFINKSGYIRYWDEQAKAPYLFNGSDFISYDDKRSIGCKIRYMKQQRIYGIMFWEYKCDNTHTLIPFMKNEINKKCVCTVPVPAVGFAPPVYFCKKTGMTLERIDGDLDKEFWQQAEFTDLFVDIEGEEKGKPRFDTRAKILWDDENLYVGAMIKGSEIWASQTERDSVIFRDNDFEIFIDPDSDTHQYFEFEMNALNTVWDLMLNKPYRDGGRPINGWDIHGLKTAVHIEGRLNDPSADNRFWSSEIVIPFKALYECAPEKRPPVSGEYYRIDFSRVQWKTETEDGKYRKLRDDDGNVLPEDNWVWAPTGVVNIHYPELWGFMFFTENGEKYAIPEDEYIKWELRRVYYEMRSEHDMTGHYPQKLRMAPGTQRYTRDIRITATEHSFEAECENGDGTRVMVMRTDGRICVYDR